MKATFLFVILAVCVADVSFGAETPTPISPGSPLGSGTDTRCPTFSWEQIDRARSYELVIYRVDHLGRGEELERRIFGGGVSSWTLPLDRCLQHGQRYAWSVRAHGRDDSSSWPDPNLFEVAAAPTEAELQRALEIVRLYLSTEEVDSEEPARPSRATNEGAQTPVYRSQSHAPAPPQLTVDGGVEAVSFSGDGAALTNLDPGQLSQAIPIAKGGTAATDAATGLKNLGGVSVSGFTGHEDDASAHHLPENDTTCDGAACDGSSFFGVTAAAGDSATGFFDEGKIEKERIADEIARQEEVLALGRCFSKSGQRYWDPGNGTIVDCALDLVWLKDASCPDLAGTDASGQADWSTAVTATEALGDGTCGLSDGSVAGDWRLPTILEVCSGWAGLDLVPCPATARRDSLIDVTVSGDPSIANARGDQKWSEGDAFLGVEQAIYWSGTEENAAAWRFDSRGGLLDYVSKTAVHFVWPVRDRP